MEFSLILIILYVCGTSAISIMPELKHNILRFRYGVNFRYEGMLSHSFDKFLCSNQDRNAQGIRFKFNFVSI